MKENRKTEMPTREEALEKFFSVWKPELKTETVRLSDAAGRVTAEDVYSAVTIPAARTAGLDGIAVHSSDFADGKTPDVSTWVEGRDYTRADTGDDFPDEFDAVIMVEWLRFDENGKLSAICLPDADARDASSQRSSEASPSGDMPKARNDADARDASSQRPSEASPSGDMPKARNNAGVRSAGLPGGMKYSGIHPGSFTRPAGSTVKKGDLLIAKNKKIRPTDLAALAVGNVTEVPVRKKPVVAFLPTGSELIEPGMIPERGQNINTNSLLVKNMLEEMGADVVTHPVMKDDKDAISDWLDEAVDTADIILINGGSSKGSEDYNIGLISEKGTVIQHNVAAVPGRPVTLALIKGKAVINLPGPTLAAYFVCDWCVRALVAAFLHQEPDEKEHVTGILKGALPEGGPVQIIHRLNVKREADGTFSIFPLDGHGAGAAAIMGSNAQYITSLFEEAHPAGSELTAELLRNRKNL